jgi:putative ABC transport system permease protein
MSTVSSWWRGARLGALGVAVGLIAVVALGPQASTLLFHVSARDPIILASTALALLAVTVFASYFPARRATRIDPIEALREL